MQIRSLRFEGFGRFHRGLSVPFRPGLNVILGPNESGKSTLVEGLIGVLFGLKDKEQEAALRPRHPYSAFAGEIEITTAGGDYRVQRDFETHRVVVTRKSGNRSDNEEIILYQGEANPRGRTDDLLACLSVIEEITGLKDREMAVRTLFMKQGELETAVDERVRHLLSGTSRGDYDQVVQRLEERYFSLTRENPWGRKRKSSKELELTETRIKDLTLRRDRAREAQAVAGRLIDEIERTRESLERARVDQAAKETLLDNYSQFFEVNRDRSDLEKRLRTIRDEKEKVKTLVAECDRIESELWPRFESFRQAGPEFGESLRSLTLLQGDVDEMEAELRKRETELTATPWPQNFRNGLICGAVTMLVTLAAMAGAGAILLGAVMGLVFGIAAFTMIYLRGKEKEKLRMKLEAAAVELSERLDGQKSELAAMQSLVQPVGGARRASDLAEEYREYRDNLEALSRLDQVRESHRSLTDLEADYDQVFQKLKIIDSRARDLIARAPYLAGADENLEQVAQGLERARQERQAAAGKATDLETALSELKLKQARFEGTTAEDVETLEEELEEAQELSNRLETQRDACGLALEVLRESIQEFQESHVDRLAGRAGELMSRITEGRYERVGLDKNFVPSLITRSGLEFQLPELSQGALDQLHLALRVAITDDYQAENAPPMLLDDVLVNCDQARLIMIRRLLTELSDRGRQVLIFAHDPRYREWGHVARELDCVPELQAVIASTPAA